MVKVDMPKNFCLQACWYGIACLANGVFQHRLKVETLRHLLIKIGSSKTFHTLHLYRFKFAFSQCHLFVKNRSVRSAFGNCLRSMALNFEQISVLLHAGFICKVVSKSQVQPRISFENPGALAEELIGKCPDCSSRQARQGNLADVANCCLSLVLLSCFRALHTDLLNLQESHCLVRLTICSLMSAFANHWDGVC